MRSAKLLFVLLLTLAWPACAIAAEAASAWFATPEGKVRLVAAQLAVNGAAQVQLGLDFALAPGWKIYWRSPGDAGLPPSLDWTGSANLVNAELAWPAPHRFSVAGLETIGYEGEMLLPITAHLARPDEALQLRARLDYLTCKDICIPYATDLALDLPGRGDASPSDDAERIAHFRARVPPGGDAAPLRILEAAIVSGNAPRLDLVIGRRDGALQAPDVFVDAPPGLGFAAPRRQAGGTRLEIPISGGAAAIEALIDRPLGVTIVDGETAATAQVLPQRQAPGDPSALPAPAGLLAMAALALLGGLTLNAMPCVLPVLSIKLLTVAAHAGRSRGAIRRGFILSAAGILAGFMLLAGMTIALKSLGLAIGWGVQFQQPVFLIGLIFLLTLFACNLAGFFEIPLPSAIAALARIGHGERGEAGHLGDFAAGLFATALATPCSAPYLGTAVGFALAGGSIDILTIFFALGLGLALPYLMVALWPGMAARLPRPGRWMSGLRGLMALLLAMTAIWLLSVLAVQAGRLAAGLLLLLLLGLAALLRLAVSPAIRRGGAATALLLALVLPFAVPVPSAENNQPSGPWHPFDPAAIAALVQQGQTVLVDVTAEWCLNCKVNERLVLRSADVARRLQDPGIVAMRADWTRPDPAIAQFLESFGRYGIPFYVVFGPALPEGRALGEILTPGAVLGALHDASPVVSENAPKRKGG